MRGLEVDEGGRQAAVAAGMLDGDGRERTYGTQSSRDGDVEDAEVLGGARSWGRGMLGTSLW
jgi:hypothetical protein